MDTRIKTRPDGSIDSAHYMARGRRCRAEQAHAMITRNAAPAAAKQGRWGLVVLGLALIAAPLGLFG